MIGNLDLDILKNHPVFSGLTDEEFGGAVKTAGIYEESFRRGENAEYCSHNEKRVGFVEKGGFFISPSSSDGAVIKTLRAGSAFGILSAFNGENAAPTKIVSLSDSKVIFIPSDRFFILTENRKIRENVFSFLAERIRFLNSRIAQFSAKNAESKLALFILENSDENGNLGFDDSLTFLSDMLSVGRASLYRSFDKFRSLGAIEKKGREIIVKNRSVLEKIISEPKGEL